MHFPYRYQQGRRIYLQPMAMSDGGGGIARHLALTGQPLLINEDMAGVMARLGSRNVPGSRTPKSGLHAPLVTGDRFRGLVSVHDHEREHSFSDSDVKLLQTLAGSLSVGLENARLFRETPEALQRQTATTEVLQVINASPGELTPVFNAVVDRATRLCAADGGRFVAGGRRPGAIQWWAGQHAQGLCRVRHPFKQHPRWTSCSARSGTASFLQVADIRHRCLPQRRAVHRRQRRRWPIRTYLGVPLTDEDGRWIGVFTLIRNDVRPFTEARSPWSSRSRRRRRSR